MTSIFADNGLIKAIGLVIIGIAAFIAGSWIKGRRSSDAAATEADRKKVGKMSDQDLHDDLIKRSRR